MDPTSLVLGIAVPAVVVTIVVAVLSYLYYSGWFEKVEFEVATPPVRNLVIMYRYGTGPYDMVTKVLDNVAKLAPEEDTLIIYYDDENEVPREKLRWAVGLIIAEGSEPIDDDLKYRLQEAGCKSHTLPCANMAVQTDIELTTRLSYQFVVRKVYPKLDEFLERKQLDAQPVIEIYEDNYLSIMAPLDKQSGFFVPEALRQC